MQVTQALYHTWATLTNKTRYFTQKWMNLDERLKNGKQQQSTINSLKQLNPISAADTVLSMRKISQS